jgi:hypothetical protein
MVGVVGPSGLLSSLSSSEIYSVSSLSASEVDAETTEEDVLGVDRPLLAIDRVLDVTLGVSVFQPRDKGVFDMLMTVCGSPVDTETIVVDSGLSLGSCCDTFVVVVSPLGDDTVTLTSI